MVKIVKLQEYSAWAPFQTDKVTKPTMWQDFEQKYIIQAKKRAQLPIISAIFKKNTTFVPVEQQLVKWVL